MNLDVTPDSDSVILERVRHVLRSVEGLTVAGVEDGVVTLAGIVASQALADSTVELAQSVDGVTDVRAGDLMWDSDPPASDPVIPPI